MGRPSLLFPTGARPRDECSNVNLGQGRMRPCPGRACAAGPPVHAPVGTAQISEGLSRLAERRELRALG
jgi:hypothetical protein